MHGLQHIVNIFDDYMRSLPFSIRTAFRLFAQASVVVIAANRSKISIVSGYWRSLFTFNRRDIL